MAKRVGGYGTGTKTKSLYGTGTKTKSVYGTTRGKIKKIRKAPSAYGTKGKIKKIKKA